jgi:hypothetical protein
MSTFLPRAYHYNIIINLILLLSFEFLLLQLFHLHSPFFSFQLHLLDVLNNVAFRGIYWLRFRGLLHLLWWRLDYLKVVCVRLW